MNNQKYIKKYIKKIPILFNMIMFFIKVKNTGTVFVRILTQAEKVKLFLTYAKKYNCHIFVETGTLRGETIYDCKDYFDELFSIELSHELFIDCRNRFLNYDKIHILEGDSAIMLPEVIKKNNKSILFWLDAHYSGDGTARGDEDTPIAKELSFILKNVSDPCILIDDARCFDGKNGYPTIKFLRKMIRDNNQENKDNLLKLEVKNDIIRITHQ